MFQLRRARDNLSAIEKCATRAGKRFVGCQPRAEDFSDFAGFGRVRQAPTQVFTLIAMRRSALIVRKVVDDGESKQ
jgi:hypothetical protein